MKRLVTLRLRPTLVAAVIALLAVLGGVAFAAIPDDSGTFQACYANVGGAVRLVDKQPTDCTNSESGTQWSQAGPAGATGAPGAAGPAGPAGPAGAPGAPGGSTPAGGAENSGTQQDRDQITLPDSGSLRTVFRSAIPEDPITLPRGAYSISAHGGTFFSGYSSHADDRPNAHVHCQLRMTEGARTRVLEERSVRWTRGDPPPDMILEGLLNVRSASGDLRLSCERTRYVNRARDPDEVLLVDARIVIIHLSAASSIVIPNTGQSDHT